MEYRAFNLTCRAHSFPNCRFGPASRQHILKIECVTAIDEPGRPKEDAEHLSITK